MERATNAAETQGGPPVRGVAIALAVVAVLNLVAETGHVGPLRLVATALLGVGVAGLLEGRTRLALVGVAGLLVVIVEAVVHLGQSGFSWPPIVLLTGVLAVGVVWGRTWARGRRDRGPAPGPERGDPPAASLVALLERPARLESTILAVRASEAWQRDVGTEEDDNESAYVVGSSPHFLVKHDAWLFAVHDVDTPYFEENERVVGLISDARIERIVTEHRGWISVDVLYAPEEQPAEVAYRLIGPLLAELVGDDLLAVHLPHTGAIYPRVPTLAAALRSDDLPGALERIAAPRVLSIREDDPRMLSAVAEARARWQEFVTAFEGRRKDDGYAVKVPVSDGESTEFLWLNVTAIENDVIYGTLGNDPVSLRDRRLNDRTTVRVGELNDWLFVDDGRLAGGFTLDVFRRVDEERRQAGTE